MSSRTRLLGFVVALVAPTWALAATQQVRLDFTTNPGNGTTTHIYTPTEQSDILTRMQQHYAAFDFSFSLTTPPVGQFSTITFNAPGVGGGDSDWIDFRNLSKNDNGRVNVNGLLGGASQPPATSANWVALTSLVGSHELGHLQGLRHADAQGPIGSGVATNGIKIGFNPDYPGPVGATESGQHVMGSPASVGQTLFQAVGPTFFGEREDVKLAFNQNPNVVNEIGTSHGLISSAQPLSLVPLAVPNTLGAGTQNFGKIFDVDAVAVIGANIATIGQNDLYRFTATANTLLQVEVINEVLGVPRKSTLDPQLSVLNSTGAAVPYFSSTAATDDEFESLDSALIDLLLPTAGTYYIKVNGFGSGTSATGTYELFAYTFAAVPEPGSMSLGAIVLSLLLTRRRRGA